MCFSDFELRQSKVWLGKGRRWANMWKHAYEMLFFSESDSGPEGPSILRRGVKGSYLHFK